MSEKAKETFEQQHARMKLERITVDIGRTLKGVCPPGVGFALFMFDFGGRGSLDYTSNARRDDIVKAMEEWLARLRRTP